MRACGLTPGIEEIEVEPFAIWKRGAEEFQIVVSALGIVTSRFVSQTAYN